MFSGALYKCSQNNLTSETDEPLINHFAFLTGDHKKPEFVKITPLCAVPAIQDDDFGMGET